jgi:hypothetical protein
MFYFRFNEVRGIHRTSILKLFYLLRFSQAFILFCKDKRLTKSVQILQPVWCILFQSSCAHPMGKGYVPQCLCATNRMRACKVCQGFAWASRLGGSTTCCYIYAPLFTHVFSFERYCKLGRFIICYFF